MGFLQTAFCRSIRLKVHRIAGTRFQSQGGFMRNMLGLLIAACITISSAVWAGPVDINHADATTIAKELKGIGPARAQQIVEYREKHGAFKSADDLGKIKGIGKKAIDKNRENIRVSEVAKK
jgi:competence protein ComEA